MNNHQKANKQNNKVGTRKDSGEEVGQKRRFGRQHDSHANSDANEWQERVIKIRRVTVVKKGGKKMSFSVLVVIGNGKGSLGVGQAKASEVVDAIRKAIANAKLNLVTILFERGSIPDTVLGKFGATEVLLFKAKKGTGLIVNWAIKSALEIAGLHNVVCKTTGSTNPINVLKALLNGISKLRTKRQIRQLRAGFVTAA